MKTKTCKPTGHEKLLLAKCRQFDWQWLEGSWHGWSRPSLPGMSLY